MFAVDVRERQNMVGPIRRRAWRAASYQSLQYLFSTRLVSYITTSVDRHDWWRMPYAQIWTSTIERDCSEISVWVGATKPRSHLRDWGPRLSTTGKKTGNLWWIAMSRGLDNAPRECCTYAKTINHIKDIISSFYRSLTYVTKVAQVCWHV